MPPLSSNDVESELSYAYLHAVAAYCGYSCTPAGRHDDNAGVDATIRARGPFAGGGTLTDVALDVQLKATTLASGEDETFLTYFLKGKKRYDVLREETMSIHRILLVLFLPKERPGWLIHSEEELRLFRCAYWVSLYGARESENTSGVSIRIPRSQKFDSEQLIHLMTRISKFERLRYSE
jgi:hypothetical protein